MNNLNAINYGSDNKSGSPNKVSKIPLEVINEENDGHKSINLEEDVKKKFDKEFENKIIKSALKSSPMKDNLKSPKKDLKSPTKIVKNVIHSYIPI